MNLLDNFNKAQAYLRSQQYDSSPSSSEEEVQKLEQSRTASPTLEVRSEMANREYSTFLMEYQMTVRTTIENLTGKEASILLSYLNYQAVHLGVDHIQYLIMEWLFNFLLKSGSLETIEYPIEKGRQTLMVSELILTVIRGSWLSLGDREQLPKEIIEQILSTGWLPSSQTVGSWKIHYSVRNFFEVRTVRLDTFQDNERNSERYSSYCKGYGEGGSLARVKRTPFSAELDGDDTERPLLKFTLLELSKYNSISLAVERWKQKNREKEKE